MSFNYIESIEAFDADQKVYFYQKFSHFLTVSMRSLLFREGITTTEQIERARWLNEVTYRITLKVACLQNDSSDFSDAEIWGIIQQNAEKHPKTAEDVNSAIEVSYKYTRQHSGHFYNP